MTEIKEKKYLSDDAQLMAEWDHHRNNELGLFPQELNVGSHKKAWWTCRKCGHCWLTEIRYRSKGIGCPICGRTKAAISKATPKPGKSLFDLYPDLAREWDYDKNGASRPQHFNIGSSKQVYWVCQNGHSWKAAINKRTYRNQGCPICNSTAKTSFPEQAIFYYVLKVCSAYNRYTVERYEFDIYIPQHRIAIEYDGQYWHSSDFSQSMETRKNDFCKENGIILFRIKDNSICEIPFVEGNVFYYKYTASHTYLTDLVQMVINHLCSLISVSPISINIEQDYSAIMESYQHTIYDNSLSAYPEVLAEWDFSRNIGISPENFRHASETKVWWKCAKGHSYSSRVSHRVNGSGCPYCANKRIINGENDLLILNPILASEWHYERNMPLMPDSVSVSSSKSVWWICSKGHEWKSTINSRNTDQRGCPYCSGRYVIKGTNDLVTLFPEIASEWDYIKNEPLLPSDFKTKSSKKVWWIGKCGHSWKTEISNRTNGQNCPYCSGHRILAGFNDLATRKPELAAELIDSEISANSVATFSKKKARWKCSVCGHEWVATIANRSSGAGCPICARKNRK